MQFASPHVRGTLAAQQECARSDSSDSSQSARSASRTGRVSGNVRADGTLFAGHVAVRLTRRAAQARLIRDHCKGVRRSPLPFHKSKICERLPLQDEIRILASNLIRVSRPLQLRRSSLARLRRTLSGKQTRGRVPDACRTPCQPMPHSSAGQARRGLAGRGKARALVIGRWGDRENPALAAPRPRRLASRAGLGWRYSHAGKTWPIQKPSKTKSLGGTPRHAAGTTQSPECNGPERVPPLIAPLGQEKVFLWFL